MFFHHTFDLIFRLRIYIKTFSRRNNKESIPQVVANKGFIWFILTFLITRISNSYYFMYLGLVIRGTLKNAFQSLNAVYITNKLFVILNVSWLRHLIRLS